MLLSKSKLYESIIFKDFTIKCLEGKKYAEYYIKISRYPDHLLFVLCEGGHKNMKKLKRMVRCRYNEYILEICLDIAIEWRYTGMIDWLMSRGIDRHYTKPNKNHPALSEFVKCRLKER